MIVTDVIEISKSRSKIYIDDEFAFVLYKGELRIYKIRINQEISDDVYQEITNKVIPKRAKLRSMNLLKTRTLTEKQLIDKLRQGNYPQEAIEEAINYVKSYGYINDLQYAKDYYQYHKEYRSKQRIKQDFTQKGISKEIIQLVCNETDYQEDQELEEKLILKLLEKKKYDEINSTFEEKRKIYGFLLRKGFSSEQIQRVLKVYIADC